MRQYGTSPNITIQFPIGFTNACLNAISQVNYDRDINFDTNYRVRSYTKTHLTAYAICNDATYRQIFSWFAIGR